MGMSSGGPWEAESLGNSSLLSRLQSTAASGLQLAVALGNTDTRLPAAPTPLIFQWSKKSAYLSKMSWSLNVSYYLTYLQRTPGGQYSTHAGCGCLRPLGHKSPPTDPTTSLIPTQSPPTYSESMSLSFSIFRFSFSANHFLQKHPPPFSPETFFFLPHVLQTTQDALRWDHAINDCLQSKRKW